MKYYAMIGGECKGPWTLEELHEGGVMPDTYVWCKGMDDWQKADEVADICRFYRQKIAEPSEDISPSEAESDSTNVPIIGELPTAEEVVKNDVPPRNLLPYAVVVTLLCCPITGIVAIYFSYLTNKKMREGKREEAGEVFRQARMWVGVTFFLGFLVYAILGKVFGG